MATHVIQRGRGDAQVADTYISSSQPDVNFGSADVVVIGGAGGSRGLFDFALPPIAPEQLMSATMRLYVLQTSGLGSVTLSRFLRSTWSEDQATWNIFSTGRTWAVAGCDGLGSDYTDANAVTAPPASHGDMYWDIDITQMAGDALVTAYRRMLVRVTASSQLILQTASSSEATEQLHRPALIIETFSGTPSIAMRRRLITYGLV